MSRAVPARGGRIRRLVLLTALFMLALDIALTTVDALSGASLAAGGTAASRAWGVVKLLGMAAGMLTVAIRHRSPAVGSLILIPLAIAPVSVLGGHHRAGGWLGGTAVVQRAAEASGASTGAIATFAVLTVLFAGAAALCLVAHRAASEPVAAFPLRLAAWLLALYLVAAGLDLAAAVTDIGRLAAVEEAAERIVLTFMAADILRAVLEARSTRSVPQPMADA